MILILLGIILAVVALLVGQLAALWIIGLILIAAGIIWLLLSSAGAVTAGRSRYRRWW